MIRSAPFFRLHSFVGCHTPPAASHRGCVPSAQLAELHVPPTEGSVHTASVAMAASADPGSVSAPRAWMCDFHYALSVCHAEWFDIHRTDDPDCGSGLGRTDR